ncbi:Flp family type IVb pilin [Brevundimonas sp.]|jgi:pilus assembly protein Flp/PilA|uniref:Flp family type IVb pilin n=1 Tax=Brevundimonas sp. TaxID=1871086 RepID=UPI00391B9409|nr:Flp family type IVb pilin [Brevundimonas sp.]MCA3718246.1 Flp family type IVb pilin [Brevundimonas sp.]
MTPLIRRFLADESGATAIEYGMICGMIFLVIITAVTLFANRATDMFDYVSSTIAAVI